MLCKKKAVDTHKKDFGNNTFHSLFEIIVACKGL